MTTDGVNVRELSLSVLLAVEKEVQQCRAFLRIGEASIPYQGGARFFDKADRRHIGAAD